MRLLKPKTHLQLFVTRRCQLRCRYCPIRKGDADMPRDVALKSVDFLLGCQSRELTLEFYGGEPLLAFDVIQETTDYALRRARALGKDLSFFIATNAIDLDARKLDWMARRKFLVELSWDGGPETHNLQRVAPAGAVDSYAALRRIADQVLRSGVACSVIPVAIPANVRSMAENFEHLLDLGMRSFDLSYGIGVYWSRKDQDAYFSQLRRITARHRKSIASGELRIGNLWPKVEPGLINPELTVDTDGSLRLLSEWLFETTPPRAPSPCELGNVKDAPDINAIYISRFHCAHALLQMYAGDPRALRIILNNIDFGFRLGKFCSSLRGRVWPDAAGPRRLP